MSYEEDREWADRFLPQVELILAPRLLRKASFQRDTREAVDLVQFIVLNKGLAVRFRDWSYRWKFPNDITIRFERPNGIETEWLKIMHGCADYLFYGWVADRKEIADWFLINLDSLRWHVRNRSLAIWEKHENFDGSSTFVSLNVKSLVPQNPPIITGSSEDRQLTLFDL